jgi:hypothetical protein
LSKGLKVVRSSNLLVDQEHGSVIKYIPPLKFENEVLANKSAYLLGEKSGLFYVPRILEENREQSWIKFEYIPGLTPLVDFLRSGDARLSELLKKNGEILSFVHDNLHLGKIDPIPDWFDCEGRHVFLHGDFNLINTQYDIQNRRIVILDWSLSPIMGTSGNWGVYYFDVAWMINTIFVFPPYMKFDYKYRKDLSDVFLKSYLLSSNNQFDPGKFKKLGKSLLVHLRKSVFKAYGVRLLRQVVNRCYFPHYLDHLEMDGEK